MKALALGIWLALCANAGRGAELAGMVLDSTTGAPIAGAIVTAGAVVTHTDVNGRYRIGGANAGTVAARAVGYGRSQAVIADGVTQAPPLRLMPIRPKALYLSYWGIGDAALRKAALALADARKINALVIDVKDDRGNVPYPSGVPDAASMRHTLPDASVILSERLKHQLYLIARIAVFKDDRYASLHPDWAVHLSGGGLYRDSENIAWIDPTKRAAWQYSIDIAEEAARLGFDEIQFDYVRFPDDARLSHAVQTNEAARTSVVSAFLAAARTRLARYNVFLAADIFGYVCWNADDTHIGQRLDIVEPYVDYLSPMLYPSGFQFGIPCYRIPVQHPYDIVFLSLRQAVRRSRIAPLRFRPWLQAFRDYAFDRRTFGGNEIRLQIEAAARAGADGWMLWNPRNRYTGDGLIAE